MTELTHIDSEGKANMVDVGHKPDQVRIACAKGTITLNDNTIKLIKENQIKKGEVLTISEIAGIQAAKRTSELIPLCHPLRLTKVEVVATISDNCVEVECTAKCIGQTGVEMEALTGANVALLTIYDMCKAVDKEMVINNVRLISKTKQNLK